MKFIFHLGVHSTDNDQIISCLLKNADALADQGILVPEHTRYRQLIRETLQALRNDPTSDPIKQKLFDAVVSDTSAERVVLSHYAFLGVTARAIGQNTFYPLTDGRARRLRNLFHQHDVEFCLGIRDPATFIPTVFGRANTTDFDAFLQGSDPMQLRWSDLVLRLQEIAPNGAVTVWCNEDTPLIWPRVLQAVSGHADGFELEGADDFIASLMTPDGFERMQRYLGRHPAETAEQKQRVLIGFLEKTVREDALEQEIDLPGWSEDYVDELSVLYDQDLEVITQIPGVEVILP